MPDNPLEGTPVAVRPKGPLDAILDGEDALFPFPTDDGMPPPPIAPQLTTTETPLEIPMPSPAAEPAIPMEEGRPAEVPPVVAEPPVVQPAAPVAGAAAEPVAAEPEGGPKGSWKAAREAERARAEAMQELQASRQREAVAAAEQARLAAELAQLRGQPPAAADPYADPSLLDDPIEQRFARLEAQNQLNAAENARLRAQQEADRRQSEIERLDATYVPEGGTHEDYTKARDFYIQERVAEAELKGEIDVAANVLRQRVASNPEAAKELRQIAETQGISEADAARAVARNYLFQQERDMMAATAARRGVPLPAMVLELAQKRGFSLTPRQADSPVVLPPPARSASEDIRSQQRGAAESSLASMPTSSPQPTDSLSYASFVGMPSDQRGRMIDYMDMASARGLVPEDWMGALQQGVTIPIPASLVSER